MRGTGLTAGEIIVSRDGSQYQAQPDGSLRKLPERSTPEEVRKLLGQEPSPGVNRVRLR